MVGTREVKTFGIKQAWLGEYLSGGAVVTWVEFPLVTDGTLELTSERAEIRDGLGLRKDTWFHSQGGRVTLRGGMYSMRILEMVTGSPVSSYLNTDMMQFGVEDELTPPAVRLKLLTLAKDAAGNEGYLYAFCYRARGNMPSIGMAQTAPGEVEIQFDLEADTKNHLGQTLSGNAYGRAEIVMTP